MRQIPGYSLWIGNAADARDVPRLLGDGIEAVVALALEEPPATRELVYCRFPLLDGAGNSPWLLRMAIDTVVTLLTGRTPTLVCCGAGMSRSPAVAAVAIHRLTRRPPEECLRTLAELGPLDVSPGFWQELLAVEVARPN